MRKRFVLVLAAFCAAGFAHADLSDPTLSVYYNFDEEGDMVMDHSTYGNHGMITTGGSARVASDRGGTALMFENTRVDMNGPEFKNLPIEGITLAVWLNHTGSTSPQTLIDAIGTDHESGLFHAEIRTGGFRWFHRDGNATEVFNINPGPVLPADEWVHFAGTYDSASGLVKTFVNGEETHSADGSGATLATNWGAAAGIGDHKGDRWYGGLMDEYFIFSRALDAAEIVTVMEGGFVSVDPRGKAASAWAHLKAK